MASDKIEDSVAYGQKYEVSSYSLIGELLSAKAHHHFSNYNTEPDGSGKDYFGEETIDSLVSDLDLYCQWKPNDCRICTVVSVDGILPLGVQLCATANALCGDVADSEIDVAWGSAFTLSADDGATPEHQFVAGFQKWLSAGADFTAEQTANVIANGDMDAAPTIYHAIFGSQEDTKQFKTRLIGPRNVVVNNLHDGLAVGEDAVIGSSELNYAQLKTVEIDDEQHLVPFKIIEKTHALFKDSPGNANLLSASESGYSSRFKQVLTQNDESAPLEGYDAYAFENETSSVEYALTRTTGTVRYSAKTGGCWIDPYTKVLMPYSESELDAPPVVCADFSRTPEQIKPFSMSVERAKSAGDLNAMTWNAQQLTSILMDNKHSYPFYNGSSYSLLSPNCNYPKNAFTSRKLNSVELEDPNALFIIDGWTAMRDDDHTEIRLDANDVLGAVGDDHKLMLGDNSLAGYWAKSNPNDESETEPNLDLQLNWVCNNQTLRTVEYYWPALDPDYHATFVACLGGNDAITLHPITVLAPTLTSDSAVYNAAAWLVGQWRNNNTDGSMSPDQLSSQLDRLEYGDDRAGASTVRRFAIDQRVEQEYKNKLSDGGMSYCYPCWTGHSSWQTETGEWVASMSPLDSLFDLASQEKQTVKLHQVGTYAHYGLFYAKPPSGFNFSFAESFLSGSRINEYSSSEYSFNAPLASDITVTKPNVEILYADAAWLRCQAEDINPNLKFKTALALFPIADIRTKDHMWVNSNEIQSPDAPLELEPGSKVVLSGDAVFYLTCDIDSAHIDPTGELAMQFDKYTFSDSLPDGSVAGFNFEGETEVIWCKPSEYSGWEASDFMTYESGSQRVPNKQGYETWVYDSNRVVFGDPNTTYIQFANQVEINDDAYQNSKLRQVGDKDGLTGNPYGNPLKSVGIGAFAHSADLTASLWPLEHCGAGAYAYTGIYSFEDWPLPYIPESCFRGSSVWSFYPLNNLPNLTSIGAYAFADLQNGDSQLDLTLRGQGQSPLYMLSIGAHAFDYPNLSQVTIRDPYFGSESFDIGALKKTVGDYSEFTLCSIVDVNYADRLASILGNNVGPESRNTGIYSLHLDFSLLTSDIENAIRNGFYKLTSNILEEQYSYVYLDNTGTSITANTEWFTNPETGVNYYSEISARVFG